MTQEETSVKVNGSNTLHLYIGWGKLAVFIGSMIVAMYTMEYKISNEIAIEAMSKMGVRPVTELYIKEYSLSKSEFKEYVDDSIIIHNRIDSLLIEIVGTR